MADDRKSENYVALMWRLLMLNRMFQTLRNILRAATYLELCVIHHNSSSGVAYRNS